MCWYKTVQSSLDSPPEIQQKQLRLKLRKRLKIQIVNEWGNEMNEIKWRYWMNEMKLKELNE